MIMNHSDQSKKGTSQIKKKSTCSATIAKPESKASTSSSSLPTQCLFDHFSTHSSPVESFISSCSTVFLMKNQKCFGCLRNDHIRSECPQKSTCEVCGQFHPTLRHRPLRKNGDHGHSGADSASQSIVLNSVSPSGVPSSVSRAIVPSTSSTTPAVTSACILGEQVGLDTVPIIPGKLKSTVDDVELCTYAFLDSGSSDTFVSEQLGAKSKKTNITLST